MMLDAVRSGKLGRLADSRVSRSERLAQQAEAVWAEAAVQFRLCEREAQDAEERRNNLKADQFAALCQDKVSGTALNDQVQARANAALQCDKAQQGLAQALQIKVEREEDARNARLDWLRTLTRTHAIKALLDERIRAEQLAAEESLELAASDDLAAARPDRDRK